MNQDVRVFPDSIYLSCSKKKASLRIDRVDGCLSLSNSLDLSKTPDYNNVQLYGFIRLKIYKYVVLVTSCDLHAAILGNNIYRARKFAIFPITRTLPFSTGLLNIKDEEELHYISLLNKHLSKGQILFSPTLDLTCSLQRLRVLTQSFELTSKYNYRFFWNKYAFHELIELTNKDLGFQEWIQPMIQGNIAITNSFLKTYNLRLCVITRHSPDYAGTRYFTRGVNAQGSAANFNEIEQIIMIESPITLEEQMVLSFTQIRGSIPMFWAEVNDLHYRPLLSLQPLDYSETVFGKHFQELANDYGDNLVVVNLLDQKGREAPLRSGFEKLCKRNKNPPLSYVYYDYHKQGSRNLPLFLAEIQSLLIEGKYYAEHGSKTTAMQTNFVRTNCMDCLDRTNVIQTSIAQFILNMQLHDIGVLSSSESLEEYDSFLQDFRLIWANTGDYISDLYTGTPALKGDVTRHGTRTIFGAFKDLLNCFRRYILNNFFDGMLQDSYDLGLGVFRPYDSLSIPDLPLRFHWTRFVAPGIFLFTTIILTIQELFGNPSLFCRLLYSIPMVNAGIYLYFHRRQYVNWPRLVLPTYAKGGWFSFRNHFRNITLKVFRFLRSGSFKKSV
ncbi:inositol polyphosphate phosphatase [Schizosaccharomyces pombe]|uniref:Uncharacterized protein C3C7.01c n=1 Tax=Schizosaccharomyces pombe (strain 972 / ATCC 24843) TaxID=284812 RepID=YF51_SCHPO|nr:putative inositol polyphosphate phosphatase [Schizosaccharomyces pombe]O14127.2 RecName: Full=Uncharacterized protein C3C7.01c [Schizosaccharomyces pombe 972h-]CAB62426.2 inositol polyphosphate phosphatase (predicted) [Schizosaccharomyces pombe]|eukprot:NP_001342934.1 putative inositol polyphosphate phosphatase [Schizosaccharomyces pombe]